MKEEYILGLDIGIASVGYGIIDYHDREKIISAGANIFKEANVENNEGRRSNRGARRLKRRRIHRLDRIKQLLQDNQLVDVENIPVSTDPYSIRVKGLNNELSKDELVISLLHLAKRRGIHNVEAVDDSEDNGNELSTKDQIKRNSNALKDKYICELQMERLMNENSVRGVRNRFKTSDYKEEAMKILSVQREFHNINEKFIEKYISLLTKRREYFEGPGKGSEYGWDQDPKKWYEQLMGRCTYFPEELRSVKYSYSADLFNALNDLNNLVLNRDENHKLEYHEKYHIIENVFKQRKKPTLKQIAKEIGVNESGIQGYRITKKGTPEFTSFKLYNDVKGIIKSKETLDDHKLLDEIAEILTVNQTPTEIIKEIQNLEVEFTSGEIEGLSKLNGYTGTHRLSGKCIDLLLKELWDSNDNQMQIFSRLQLKPKKYQKEFKHAKQIPVTMIDDFILSPVVKRSMIQAIRMINRATELYGPPKDIIIELARESNSADRKRFINNIQKNNEKTNRRLDDLINQYSEAKVKGIREKIRLHESQEGKCLYSLEPIPMEDLLRNPDYYEVDHIIPKSISFDNSQNNKVLVKQEENSNKGNRTPYQYLSSSKSKISYNQFKQHILNLSKSSQMMTKKKREYLLEERDISKFTVQKEFINRNLVDTRYATRELMMLLKTYYNVNGLNVNIKSINGAFTSYLRRAWEFPKDRNEGYKHHAEDALIIANADFLFKEKKELKKANKLMNKPNSEDEDLEREVLSKKDYESLFETPRKMYDIKNYKHFKYNHMVDKKPNRQLINDTIYSTREDGQGNKVIVNKIKDLYSKDNSDIANLKKSIFESPEKILMYHYDKKTFDKLKMIFEQYAEAKNPLAKYFQEEGKYLTKYSKRDNGPVVKSIKLYGNRVGSYHNLKNKYTESRNDIVQLSMKPFRFDVYLDDGVYKFVTIRYIDLKKKNTYYELEKNSYSNLLEKKKICDEARFISSFYTGSLIEIDGQIFRIIGVNDDSKNRIEIDFVDISYKQCVEMGLIKSKGKQKRITVGKKINSIKPLSTDVLGNLYNVKSKKHPSFIIKRGI